MGWALAERLTETEQVIIVDRPVSLLRERKAPPLKAPCDRLPGVEDCWHYRPLHYPEGLPGIGRIVKLFNRHCFQRELDQLLPNEAKRIVCYDSPTQDQLVGKLEEDLSIYLVVDDRTLTVWGDPIAGEIEAEKRLLGKIDKVVCVSEPLADILRSRMQGRRNLPIYVLPNGYDERLFNSDRKYQEPVAFASIPRPRILVAGHISERIDWDGIIGAARLRPQWTWIFVGPADSGMKERITDALRQHGFYHPPIPVTDVPAWIHHCDACAVPYRLNSFTRASYPLKAIEYLAMGAPVLSTRIPSLVRYDEAIEWVNESDGESYCRTLDTFANQGGNRKLRTLRQQAVSGDSWGVRVGQFKEIVFNARL
jgi:glycosyltransferase involved in cell wall biosynthesis